MKRLERGRLYHCREESTGCTGQFSITDRGMTLKLFDYDEFFHVKSGVVYHARLENSSTVSLYDTVTGGAGSSSVFGQDPNTTHFADIHSDTVVLGYRPWEPTDPIRRVWFRINKSKDLLRNLPAVRRFAKRSSSMLSGDSRLFELSCQGVVVRCWYVGSGSFELGLSEWWPNFELEFLEPRHIGNYLADVHRILRFFSAAAGFQLTPSEICISRVSGNESEKQTDGGPDDQHVVEYLWRQPTVREYDLHSLNSFVSAGDARAIKTMVACLTAWLDRPPEWEEASTLMMGSLGLHDEISGDRLLMACRWLDKIPGTLAEPALNDDDVAKITNAAVQEATKIGQVALARRIAGSLRYLRYESNRDRFLRLIRKVKRRFPDNPVDEAALPHLLRAQELRGAVAHGLFDVDKGNALELQRAFTSMECLSYLLMIEDLPLTAASRRRATSSRVVRDYQYAKLASQSCPSRE
jgi:hypothetical protein